MRRGPFFECRLCVLVCDFCVWFMALRRMRVLSYPAAGPPGSAPAHAGGAGFLVAMRPTQRGGRGAAEVAGHLKDIVLGGATSESGLLQGRSGSRTCRKAVLVLLERGMGRRDIPANLPSQRIWRGMLLHGCFVRVRAHGNRGARGLQRCRGLAQGGRQPESAWRKYSADHPRARSRAYEWVVLWIKDGACSRSRSRGGARAPVVTRGRPTAACRYRWITGAGAEQSRAAWGRARAGAAAGVATLALAIDSNQHGTPNRVRNPICIAASKECIVRPLMG